MENLITTFKNNNYNGDVFIEKNEELDILINDSKIETIKTSISSGAGVRIFKNGKMSFGFITDKNDTSIKDFLEKLDSNVYIEGYEDYELSEPKNSLNIKISDNKNFLVDEKIKILLYIEEKIKKYSKYIKEVKDISFSGEYNNIRYFNSKGIDVEYKKTFYSIYFTVIAEKDGKKESVDEYFGDVLEKNIDVEKMINNATQNVLNLLDAKSIKTGKYSVIIPPKIASVFLEILSSSFLGDNIYKGKSLFKDNKIGDKLFNSKVVIIDDPTLDYKTGSFLIDGEGELPRKKYVVRDGILENFLLDKQYGKLLNKDTTGNSIRNSYKDLPEIGASNFYIERGKYKYEDIIKNYKGIFVNSLMGVHLADPVSGNFSFGINGWLIENGEMKHGIKEVALTGNIRDFFNNVEVICDDIVFYNNFGSPTLFVKDIEIAGSG